MLCAMIATATLIACIAILGCLVILQRRRERRGHEDTTRLRSPQRWPTVEDARDPGESFVEDQARKHVPPSEAGREGP